MPNLLVSPSADPTDPACFGVRSFSVSPRVCSAIVLTINAYTGRFTRSDLARLSQRYGEAVRTSEFSPVLEALGDRDSVYVSLAAEAGDPPRRPRR